MKALIESAHLTRAHGVGEMLIVGDEWWTVWVYYGDAGYTVVDVYEGQTGINSKLRDREEYRFFLPTLADALPLARRRLVAWIAENCGGKPQELALAKNLLQREELRLFPNHVIV